ncbi:hypothetical protein CEXT_800331 [Caerostris extrusa]|uniref:Uncharacterized protein n=1 Tax=Caerostris extrusa TaxID=172846 RepID=A0AAV4TC18_CAEEX|nr:hypothetical protein CEXT_800331 [Caerostris extrusa]
METIRGWGPLSVCYSDGRNNPCHCEQRTQNLPYFLPPVSILKATLMVNASNKIVQSFLGKAGKGFQLPWKQYGAGGPLSCCYSDGRNNPCHCEVETWTYIQVNTW